MVCATAGDEKRANSRSATANSHQPPIWKRPLRALCESASLREQCWRAPSDDLSCSWLQQTPGFAKSPVERRSDVSSRSSFRAGWTLEQMAFILLKLSSYYSQWPLKTPKNFFGNLRDHPVSFQSQNPFYQISLWRL